MVLAQVFAGRDEEAGRAAGRVADDVVRRRRGHLDHQPDDVARRAELAVLPGAGDLAEHVLVEVALGVAVLHRHVVEQVDDLGQQRRRGDGEARVLHVVGVGGVVAAERAQEREDVLADDREHLGRREVLEARPAQVLVGALLRVFALREDAPLDRLLQPGGLVLFQRLQVVEPAQEEQVGDLLDDLERVGDAARPEGVPDAVDLTPRYRCHSPWSASSSADVPCHATRPRSMIVCRSARPISRSTYLSITRIVWPGRAQSSQAMPDLFADQRREAFGGLVEDHEVRVGHQRASDREHLLLAAGELVAHVAGALGQAREQAEYLFDSPGVRAAVAVAGEGGEVLAHGEVGERSGGPRAPGRRRRARSRRAMRLRCACRGIRSTRAVPG